MLKLPAHHLVTHGVVVGMTGSGKTGLVTALLEEALRAGVPSIVVDVNGDLPNLLLSFPSFEQGSFVPWLESSSDGGSSAEVIERASQAAEQRRVGLVAAGIGEGDLQRYCDATSIRVLTPGSTAGEPLHVLSPLERRSDRWDTDQESARAALSAAVSLALRLLGRDADPAKSKEHVLLSLLAERRLLAGEHADLDYRALSNAGLWCVGRLQTDADRARVLDGLAASLHDGQEERADLARTVQRLANRWFVVRNAHASSPPVLLQPRYAMSWLRGPMTRSEMQRGRAWRRDVEGGLEARAQTLRAAPDTGLSSH